MMAVTQRLKHHWEEWRELTQSGTLRSLSFILSANFLVVVFGFLSSVLVLRNMDQGNIAVLYPLISLLMLIDQIGDLGLATSFTKVASSYQKSLPEKVIRIAHAVFKTKLGIAACATLIGVVYSNAISIQTLQTQLHAPLVKWVMVIAFFSILGAFYQSYLQIGGHFRKLSVVKVVPNFLKALILLSLVLFNQLHLQFALVAFLLVPFGIFLLGALFSDRRYWPNQPGYLENFSEVFHFSKWILISNVAVAFIGQIDLLMLSAMSTPSEVTKFLGGQRLAIVLPVLITSAVTVLLPKVSSYQTQKELHYYFWKLLRLAPLILLFVALVMPIAPFIVTFLFGQKYASSAVIFQIYVAQFSLDALVTLLSLILYSLNKAYVFSALNIVQLGLNALLNYFLIPNFGALGVSFSAFAIRILAFIVVLVVCYRSGVIFYSEKKNQ